LRGDGRIWAVGAFENPQRLQQPVPVAIVGIIDAGAVHRDSVGKKDDQRQEPDEDGDAQGR
jgi:hypothetical protein